MAKGLIDKWIDKWLESIFDAEWLGRRGEKLTARELQLVKLLGRSGKILRNVYLPKDNEEMSEIDVLFITQKGIFVIESKNYSGWIFGNEKDVYWTASLQNGIKNRFYNPILQNNTHMKWLGKYLEENIPLFSIIAFSERCELKKITVENQNVRVIKRDKMYGTIRELWESSEDRLDKEKVQEIHEKLKKLTHVDKAVKQAHIDAINKKYNAPKNQPKTKEETAVCQEETERLEELEAVQETEKPKNRSLCRRQKSKKN